MNQPSPSPDHPRRAGTVPSPAAGPAALDRLTDALRILERRVLEAAAERRAAPPGSDRRRRADEQMARLNGLYLRLQRRMEIPPEIWLLDRPAAARRVHGRET